jgi:hypothetical protein
VSAAKVPEIAAILTIIHAAKDIVLKFDFAASPRELPLSSVARQAAG